MKKSREAKTLDNEFYDILNWITELVKTSPTNYDPAEEILNLVSNAKNELKILKTKYWLFDDDCKLYCAVNDDEVNKMQMDLKSLESWLHKWQLPFNAAKCKVMHFGHSNPKRTYKMNNLILKTSDHEKDLGVIIDVHVHTAAVIKKSNQVFGMTKKTHTS